MKTIKSFEPEASSSYYDKPLSLNSLYESKGETTELVATKPKASLFVPSQPSQLSVYRATTPVNTDSASETPVDTTRILQNAKMLKNDISSLSANIRHITSKLELNRSRIEMDQSCISNIPPVQRSPFNSASFDPLPHMFAGNPEREQVGTKGDRYDVYEDSVLDVIEFIESSEWPTVTKKL
jgi:hypothetical protein